MWFSLWSTLLAAPALWGLLLMIPLAKHAGYQFPYQSIFQQVAGSRWIERAAQVWAESGFNPKAQSSVGAKGLAQAMDATWRDYQKNSWVPKGSSPFDPLPAIMGQDRYMLWIAPHVAGIWHAELGSYNAGLGTVLKAEKVAGLVGVPGVDAWLAVLPRVSGVANAAQTAGYIKHNDAYLTIIQKEQS